MAITRISNNVILDGTILPAKLNVSANMRTFLGNETISTINGGTGANDDLTLQGTTNATRTTSYVLIQPNGGNVGIGVAAPTVPLDVNGISRVTCLYLSNSATSTAGGIDNNGNSSAGLWFNNFSTIIAGYNGIIFRSSLGGTSGQTERMRITNTGQVSIGTASPSISAMLQIDSTTQGFLPPRMTVAQRDAIASVAEGLVVYSTDAGVKTLSLHNGTAWGNVLTTHSASFTSDTLAAALSDESGTSGGFTRAVGATHTSPIISTALTLNATSYSYGAGAREAMLNSMSNRFVYKDGLIPYAEIFDDFPNTLNGAGTHRWATTAGTVAYYTNGTAQARFWGAISLTTAATTDASASISAAQSGGANGQTSSRFGLSMQVCFCVNNTTATEFRSRFSGGGASIDTTVLFSTGVIQLDAVNIGGVGVNSVTVATGLSLAAGNFISGTRYRLFTRIISQTQTEVYFASAPWDSATWTTLVDTVVTHSAWQSASVSTQPFLVVITKENVAKIAYIDWVAIRQEVQR